MAYKVYISGSNQDHNLGVANYGTEADRMQALSDRVKYWLDTQGGKFEVFRNNADMTLTETCADCNNKKAQLFIENHSNAASESAAGTEAYYYGQGGIGCNSYKIAKLLYDEVAPLSPGRDRGVKPDTSLYKSGLYVIQCTNPAAALIEVIFHTNQEEVIDFISTFDDYAKAEARAICKYFGETFIEPIVETPQPAPVPLMTYTVQRGDNLSGIASKHGISLARIKELNPQIANPSLIYAGQVVCVEGAIASTPPTAPTAPATPCKGQQVSLSNVPLYSTASASVVAGRKSGTYYLWDGLLINGRYRITNRADRVGVKGQVTGFVESKYII